MRADTQSSLAAEVIREFMEFYRLDYSLAIFGPEANLKGNTENRSDLTKRAGLKSASQDKPLLVQIIEALCSGVGASQAPVGDKAPSPIRAVEPLSQISAPKSTVTNVVPTA